VLKHCEVARAQRSVALQRRVVGRSSSASRCTYVPLPGRSWQQSSVTPAFLTTVQAAYGTSAATDAVLYNDLVAYAGMMGHVDVVKHLLEQGALWPSTLWHANVLPYHNMVAAETQCWSLPALQYAISAGCPWGDWPYVVCSELVACGYAAEVSWAQANGCPCGADCPAR
jgi:hypothetical protein